METEASSYNWLLYDTEVAVFLELALQHDSAKCIFLQLHDFFATSRAGTSHTSLHQDQRLTMQPDFGQSTNASPGGSVAPSSPTQRSRKRKAPSTGSRGVATLTPDQLAKKRANDREAQRAIRERTKQTIDTLERRIEELTTQQPYQELQTVIREKDAIQAENTEIRRRLASILALIQPVVGAQGLTGKWTALPTYSYSFSQIWQRLLTTMSNQACLNRTMSSTQTPS